MAVGAAAVGLQDVETIALTGGLSATAATGRCSAAIASRAIASRAIASRARVGTAASTATTTTTRISRACDAHAPIAESIGDRLFEIVAEPRRLTSGTGGERATHQAKAQGAKPAHCLFLLHFSTVASHFDRSNRRWWEHPGPRRRGYLSQSS